MFFNSFDSAEESCKYLSYGFDLMIKEKKRSRYDYFNDILVYKHYTQITFAVFWIRQLYCAYNYTKQTLYNILITLFWFHGFVHNSKTEGYGFDSAVLLG
jgi:hypothetical protein